MSSQLRWFRAIAEVPREAWDALAAPLETPFLEWEWLRTLEDSGSICPDTGWHPLHLTLWRDGLLVAAAPLYAKTHSAGEFVWDHVWADVAEQLGTPYYPKLIGMSPATPVPGYRFLVAPGEDEDRIVEVLLQAIDRLCRDYDLTGVHFPYAESAWQLGMERRGFLAWRHQSFLWTRRDARGFDDYLAAFNRNQRRNVRRERAVTEREALRVDALSGSDLRQEDLRDLYRFYALTNARFGPWAAKYLNEAFFVGLAGAFRDHLLLFRARPRDEEAPLAMSLLVTKGSGLWGRYWGSERRIDGLHFELCYYRPIEWALTHCIDRFDPGIGGEHKVRGGFRAVANHSLHRFADPRLQAVMAAHIGRINALEQERIDELNQGLPLSKTPSPPPPHLAANRIVRERPARLAPTSGWPADRPRARCSPGPSRGRRSGSSLPNDRHVQGRFRRSRPLSATCSGPELALGHQLLEDLQTAAPDAHSGRLGNCRKERF